MFQLAKRRCLVTGGAGFIGSHLVDQLIQMGCQVRVLDNLTNGKVENISQHLNNERFQFTKGSVTDPIDVDAAMTDIDVVFHLACLGVRHSIAHPFENHRVNVEGALLVLNTAHRQNVERFIYCSSSEVYGTAEFVPMTETHPTHPCTIYGASKLAGEAYARAYFKTYGMKTLVVRPFNTYGPRSHHEGDAGEFIPKSIVRALNGKAIMIFGDGEQTRDFTYVEDTIKGLIAAAESDEIIGKTVNMGSGFEISIKELAGLLIELIGNSPVKIDFTENRPGDVLRLFADSSHFKSITGWAPETKLRKGLLKTIAYFRENAPLGIDKLLAEESGLNWKK
jgi:UDP-glucose 4-epimerase